MTTPRRHRPAPLRIEASEPRPEAWAIGMDDLKGGFGMVAGPWDSEATALEYVGEDGFCIIHFLSEGERVAWVWDEAEREWVEKVEAESPVRSERVIIHTDGSASAKDRTGGWAFIVRYRGQQATRCGYVKPTTISEMELVAIQRSLRFLTATSIPVSIYTDSQYAQRALTEWGDQWEQSGWVTATGKHVSHVNLIKDIRLTLSMHRTIREVSVDWIKGHAGHPDNHIADDLAGQARRQPGCSTWRAEDWKFHRHYASLHGLTPEFAKAYASHLSKTSNI